MLRIGQGIDAHKFDGSAPLKLGGVTIPYEQGFRTHSDGDVVLHALCDALLGAIAAGDLGRHFPDTDAKWKGVDSRVLLRNVFEKVKAAGYQIGNVDVTIVAQAPKMASHVDAMRQNIAEDLETVVENVSVKATTSDRLGFVGRKEGIVCQAVVLITKST